MRIFAPSTSRDDAITMMHNINTTVRLCVLLLVSSFVVPVFAQNRDVEKLRKQRWKMIDYYHFSTGVGFEHNINTIVTPRLSLGIGSFRNLFSADAGIGYEIVNPIPWKDEEGLGLHRFTTFVSASINVIRWRTGSFYFGSEASYSLNLRTRHRLPDGLSLNDPDLAIHHPSVCAKMGLRYDYWDFCAYYCYDLSPAFNQKHIYESADYDFYVLEPSIYERNRIGFRVTYHLTLRPQ